MTRADIEKYQAESVMRAKMPPVAKHSQTNTKQPERAAA
ncbi:hypothetical protein [Leclercia sp.]|nr:hypothetical protein [Leclercia sp.]